MIEIKWQDNVCDDDTPEHKVADGSNYTDLISSVKMKRNKYKKCPLDYWVLTSLSSSS